MVHDLIPMAVEIKIKMFEKPARLVNAMELACAIGMAYAQAGLPMPELKADMGAREFWSRVMPQIKGNERVIPPLQEVIGNYIFKKKEQMDEESLITLQLGYDAVLENNGII